MTKIKKTINTGDVSRFIKKEWCNFPYIDATAFDLRDIEPPETYVSFFLVTGHNKELMLNNAKKKIPTNLICQGGGIIILKIEQCLEAINDEQDDLISFQKEKKSHCGLYYLTDNLQKIVEAKTTLCLLAKDNFFDLLEQNNISDQNQVKID